MKHRIIPPEYAKLADLLFQEILPWRRLTIAIDGVDGSGKSSLARFLAWQLEIPVIETDFFLHVGMSTPSHDVSALKTLVDQRHQANRPVIVEGVLVLRQLHDIGVDPEFLVCVQCAGRHGSSSWQQEFTQYRMRYPRASAPNYTLNWSESE